MKLHFLSKKVAMTLALGLSVGIGACSTPGSYEFAETDGRFTNEHQNSNELVEEIVMDALEEYTGGQDVPRLDMLLSGGAGGSPEEIVAAADDGSFAYNDDIIIEGEDGVKLAANVFTPKNPVGTYPAVIFVNSWASDEHQYTTQAAELAKRGFIVFSYSTRGFGTSEGLVNVAGPKDMADLGRVLDWIEDNTPVEPGNIGMAGISYGAGMSLLGLSQHDRVKTAAALSGWTDLVESLWGGETPRLVWATLLIAGGYLAGNMDPIIAQNFATMLAYDLNRKQEVIDWAAARSAHTYIDSVNAANKPVYISNNWHDNLFQTTQILDYYEDLTGPKKMDIANGIHGMTEDYVWNNVYAWMEYHLKGESGGIMDDDLVSMKLKDTGDRVHYADWPASEVDVKTMYLKPRGWFSGAKLQDGTYNKNKTNSWHSGWDTVASTGIPILSGVLDSSTPIDVSAWLPAMDNYRGIVYDSNTFDDGLKIRGDINLTLQTQTTRSEAAYNVYVYERDFWGTGKLITHGTFSLHEAPTNKTISINIEVVSAAYDLDPGKRLSVAIDTFDPLYAPPTLRGYTVRAKHSSSRQSTLRVEVEN